jgi:hypothetical protein
VGLVFGGLLEGKEEGNVRFVDVAFGGRRFRGRGL